MSTFWPFSAWSIPQTLQKRLLKFLLKRAVGQFLASELDLDNLDVELGNGQVYLKDLDLNLEVLNDLAANLPIIVTDGRIGRIHASVPWKELGTGNCTVELDGLYIEVKPLIDDPENGLSRSTQMSESHILSSSIHFAETFLRSEISEEDDLGLPVGRTSGRRPSGGEGKPSVSSNSQTAMDSGLEGIQVLATLIDKILAKIRIVARNTTIRLCYRSNEQAFGESVAEHHLDIVLPIIGYEDDAQTVPGNGAAETVSSLLVKAVRFRGVNVRLSRIKPNHDVAYGEENFEEERSSDIYETSATLASTSTEEEDFLRISINRDEHDPNVTGNAAPRLGQQNNAGTTIEGSIHAICGLLTPDQLDVLMQISESFTEGLAILAKARRQGMGSELGRNHDSTPHSNVGRSSLSLQTDIAPGAWPNNASPSQAMNMSIEEPKGNGPFHLRLNIHHCNLYMAYSTVPTKSESHFYQVLFTGRKAARGSTDYGSDLSTSVITQINTKLNAGKGVLDGMLAETLGIEHIKVELCDAVVQVLVGSRSVVNFTVRHVDVSEWLVEGSPLQDEPHHLHISKGSYNPILRFESNVDISQVNALYDQLRACQPPRDFVFEPSRTNPIPRSRVSPQSKEESVIPAIRCTMGTSPFSDQDSPESEYVDEFVQMISVKLGPCSVYVSLPLFSRLEQLLPMNQPTSTGSSGGTQKRDAPTARATVGFIMDDLDQTGQFLDDGSFGQSLHCQAPLLRCWISVPNTEETNGTRSEMFLVDLIDMHATSSSEAANHISPRRTSFGSIHQHMPNTCCEGDELVVRRWALDCEHLGIALVRKRSTGEADIRPFASISPQAKPTSTKNGSNKPITRPNVEITVRSHVCPSLLQRPTAEVYATPTGLRFNRGSDEDVYGGFGFQSWYDIGSGGKSPRRPPGHDKDDEDDDLLWFKQRTIEESFVYLNCCFPLCHLNLVKSDYDLIQILLNHIALYQTQADADNEQEPTSPSSFTSTSSTLLKFGQTGNNRHLRADGMEGEQRSWVTGSESGQRRSPTPLTAVATSDSFRANIHLQIPSHENPTHMITTSYNCALDELRLFTINGHAGKHTSYFWIDSDDISFSNAASCSNPAMTYLYRTLPKTLQAKQMLSASFLLTYDEELNMKETTVAVNLNHFTLRYVVGSPVFSDVGYFLKEPPELVFVDTADRFTKLHVNLTDTCIDYQPLYMPVHAVLVFDTVKISCNLIPDSPTVGVKFLLYNTSACILEDDQKQNISSASGRGLPGQDGYLNTRKHWATLGFANVASCDFFDVSVRTNSGNIQPNFELEITNNQLSFDTCADSHLTLVALLKYISEGGDLRTEDLQSSDVTQQAENTMQTNVLAQPWEPDVFASLDEDAFKTKGAATESGSNTAPEDLEMEDVDDIMNQSILLQFDDEDGSFSPNILDEFEVPSAPSTPKSPRRSRKSFGDEEGRVRFLEDPSTFHIIEDFFSRKLPEDENTNAEGDGKSKSVVRIRLRDLDISWKLHDGYDWESTRQTMFERDLAARKGKSRMHSRSREGSAGQPSRRDSLGSEGATTVGISPFDYDTSSELSYANDENIGFDIGNYFLPTLTQQQLWAEDIHARDQDRDDTASVRSGMTGVSVKSRETTATSMSTAARRKPTSAEDLARSQSSQMIIKAYALNVKYDVFPDDVQTAWHLGVTIRDVEIIDNVRTSRWRKFLSYRRPDGNALPRETSSKMVKFDLSSVRPNLGVNSDEELRLKVTLLPLRMHVDQDALNCLLRFFSFENPRSDQSIGRPAQDNTFFQLVDIHPASVKIDYKPKHVDYSNLKGGNFIEIMNFFQLDGAEMALRGVRLTGVRGWSRLVDGVISQWLPHIKNTQLPKMASGVSGVKSLINIGSGLADLVLLPIEQYKKDGRIIRGLQKGAKSFAKAATTETINLGTKLAVGTQVLLEHADEILGGGVGEGSGDDAFGSGDGPSSTGGSDHVSKYAEQPKDVKEGVKLAYRSLSRNIATAARTVFAVPMEVYENTGTQGTVRAVIRAVPVAVLKPMIGATEAVSKTLMGLQNTMDPSKRMQMEDKYKG